MANLVSPGVQVSVTDESVYGPAGAGTVPMLFIATGQDKTDPTGTETDGIAKYTKAANAGKPVLVTSQRELTQYFGNIDFRTVSGTVQQGDETNDYGLLAAYSFLGQSASAYIVRADIDLTALRPQTSEPTGDPANLTYWLDPSDTNYGIYEYTATGWVAQTPTVEIVATAGAATASVVVGDYLVEVVNGTSDTQLVYYRGISGTPDSWDELDTGFADTVTYAPHYSVPSSPSVGDVWIKTTVPGGGLDVDLSLFQTTTGNFTAQTAVYANDASTDPTGIAGDVNQDGTAGAARTLAEGDIWLAWDNTAGSITIKRYDSINAEWDDISTDPTVATGGYVMEADSSQPVGDPANGALWYDSDVDDLAIYEVAVDGGVQKWMKASDVQYGSSAPLTDTAGGALADGDYWVDTDADGYPVIYRHNGTDWVLKDNTDQSTADGVVFGDITDTAPTGGSYIAAASVLTNGPNPLVYPVGMTAINMCRSAGTVRQYDSSLGTTWKWRNFASNQADGSGSFLRKAQRQVVVAAMQAAASGTELREDTVQFRIIAAPGYPEMFDEMVTLNSDRNETAFIIVDAPFRKNSTEILTWIDGTDATENGEDGLVGRNTYAAAYYPSVLTTDPVSGNSVVAPASHSVLYTYAYSDNVSFQWFAPAGLTRGVVQNATNVGYLNSEDEFVPIALTQGTRDAMYEKKLNPIARFPAEGIVVFGQKSLHTAASALDRVNVARLTAYLRERFAVIGRPYLFEPNDVNTRTNAKATFDGFMANIMAQRGVYDFAVVCDETNNTPARIDRNELYIDIAIEPTKAAEFIYIPIRIVNTGELG
jgi:hypothetical protein